METDYQRLISVNPEKKEKKKRKGCLPLRRKLREREVHRVRRRLVTLVEELDSLAGQEERLALNADRRLAKHVNHFRTCATTKSARYLTQRSLASNELSQMHRHVTRQQHLLDKKATMQQILATMDQSLQALSLKKVLSSANQVVDQVLAQIPFDEIQDLMDSLADQESRVGELRGAITSGPTFEEADDQALNEWIAEQESTLVDLKIHTTPSKEKENDADLSLEQPLLA